MMTVRVTREELRKVPDGVVCEMCGNQVNQHQWIVYYRDGHATVKCDMQNKN